MTDRISRDREGVTFNDDGRFDFRIKRAVIDERRLADIFVGCIFQRDTFFELKTDRLAQRYGNLAIEYEYNGRPSCIAHTKADIWVHELRDDDGLVGYFMVPVPRLRELCRDAMARGLVKDEVGEKGRSKIVTLPIAELLRLLV